MAVLAGHVAFALPLAEGYDLNTILFRKLMNCLDERVAYRSHQHRRGDLGATMAFFEEVGHPATGLDPRLIQVEI